jgi:hypothetical protein
MILDAALEIIYCQNITMSHFYAEENISLFVLFSVPSFGR